MDGSQLNQDVAAVPLLLDHALNGFDMAADAG